MLINLLNPRFHNGEKNEKVTRKPYQHQNFISSRRSSLAHACHVSSTSAAAIVGHPAHRMTENELKHYSGSLDGVSITHTSLKCQHRCTKLTHLYVSLTFNRWMSDNQTRFDKCLQTTNSATFQTSCALTSVAFITAACWASINVYDQQATFGQTKPKSIYAVSNSTKWQRTLSSLCD